MPKRKRENALGSFGASVQVLSTRTVDGSPSVLITLDSERIAFNAGEGWQRFCVENGVKMHNLRAMCVTELTPGALGGVPGYCLTASESDLRLAGPQGLDSYMKATRHFMPSNVTVEELKGGPCLVDPESLLDVTAAGLEVEDNVAVVYIVKTPPVLGKFDVRAAQALGVPAGPMYGQLKRGESVTLTDGRVIEPQQVVAASTPGAAVAVVPCPSLAFLPSLRYLEQLDVVVHLAPASVAETKEFHSFLSNFPNSTTHILTHRHVASPFRTALADARLLHSLAPSLYVDVADGVAQTPTRTAGNVVDARPMLRYTLVPLTNRGLDESQIVGSETASSTTTPPQPPPQGEMAKSDRDTELEAKEAELVFLGTGSAVPSKHRNVAAIYLKCRKNAGMMLDVGEGAVGQLARAYGAKLKDVLETLHAVWISHPHADHHLGLPGLLTARKAHQEKPIILMAPAPVLRWLAEYEIVDPSIKGTYTVVELAMIQHKATPHPYAAQLEEDLGITNCWNVRVDHCPHAYGLIVSSLDGWSLCYSGDCRPTPDLAAQARGVTVLIHEATFDDDYYEDALAKRHSTISEALAVADDMRAHRTLLTHFSQRYSAMPQKVTNNATAAKYFFASDFLKVAFPDLVWAPSVLPAIQAALAATERT